MKYLKMLGLAAVASIALTAFFAAGSASATVLCTKNEIPCPAGEDYAAGIEIQASLEAGIHSVLKDTFGNIVKTCTISTIKGKTANTGGPGEAVRVNLETLTFANCTAPTVVVQKGELEIDYIEGSATRGTLTLKGTKITTAAAGGDCVYGAGALAHGGLVTGGALGGTIHLLATLIREEGGLLCPADLVWEAKYTITAPVPFYIKDTVE